MFLIQHFCLHGIFLFSKSCPEIDQPQSAGKENILKSKAHDKSIQARKQLFCHVILKNYFCNVLCKFLIKFQSTRRREVKEQTPQLTLLYCGRVARSSRRSFSIKKAVLKNFTISTGNTCVGDSF